MFKTKVIITEDVADNLYKLPKQVTNKLIVWQKQVKFLGIREVRKIKGYHDEPLRGDRKEQRSFRLNKAYRGFYITGKDGKVEIVKVIDVNKHKY